MAIEFEKEEKSNHWSLNPEIRDEVIEVIKKARAKQSPTNLGRKWSDEFKTKVREGVKRAYKEGRLKPYAHWTGKKMSTETREKMSESAKKCENSGRFKAGHIPKHAGKTRPKISGPNHWKWKGGISSIIDKKVHTLEWKQLRLRIYQRDRWKCQVCGKHCWKDIQCHHIISVREDGNDESENLVTLCSRHHLKIEGSKLSSFWQYYLGNHVPISLN